MPNSALDIQNETGKDQLILKSKKKKCKRGHCSARCESSGRHECDCQPVLLGHIGPTGPTGAPGPTGAQGPCCTGATGAGFIEAFGYFFQNSPTTPATTAPGAAFPISSVEVSTPNIVNNGNGTFTVNQSGTYRISYGVLAQFPASGLFFEIALATVAGSGNVEILNTSFTSDVSANQPLNSHPLARAEGSVILPIPAGTTICVINNTSGMNVQLFPLVFNLAGERNIGGYLTMRRMGDLL